MRRTSMSILDSVVYTTGLSEARCAFLRMSPKGIPNNLSTGAVNEMTARPRRPVVLSVKTFPSWDFGTTAETGDITMPFPGEASDGGHAICLVGYLLDTAAPGGGRLIFLNSWGRVWAAKSDAAAGYGTLPFEYVKKYALEAFA